MAAIASSNRRQKACPSGPPGVAPRQVAGHPVRQAAHVARDRLGVGAQFEVAGGDLLQSRTDLHAEPAGDGQRRRGQLGPDEPGHVDRVDAFVGEGAGHRGGLGLTQLGQRWARDRGRQGADDVGGRLPVADQQQSHGHNVRGPVQTRPRCRGAGRRRRDHGWIGRATNLVAALPRCDVLGVMSVLLRPAAGLDLSSPRTRAAAHEATRRHHHPRTPSRQVQEMCLSTWCGGLTRDLRA